ncbi:RNA polymerase sigma O factor [Cupriavidus necator N-1]|uniref:RNA polymerase sigma factor n=1 Tax=Cupriavidus necator (strain ATCC 43291 / DSM 13513 / CCUG 52238 / LMG 8453 / N-1) TaxID=1042878 RepID=G0EXF7_CUPNN|nr:RNA polymerase sigma factor [Cupriavidus necator]AEI76062.1 RNA polymerase sigma O factor [Cupriavidus necator N-1]MDX6011804.1 RNA polymerase sigma factor [Cupriavidus necator]
MDHASDERRRFDELVLPQLDAAYNLARWLSGSASEADDVVQEAFLRAYRHFGSFHGEQPRPWLLAIVRNTWFTTCQKRKSAGEVCSYDDLHENQPLPAWHDGQDSPEQWLLRQEDVRLVHRALEQLPVAYREVLVLRELEELPYRDIARVADIAIGTVMSRLARGRRMLAAAVTALQQQGTAQEPAHARPPSGALAPAPHPAGETGHGLQ